MLDIQVFNGFLLSSKLKGYRELLNNVQITNYSNSTATI